MPSYVAIHSHPLARLELFGPAAPVEIIAGSLAIFCNYARNPLRFRSASGTHCASPRRTARRGAAPHRPATWLAALEDRAVLDLPVQLAPGDVLAVNDTRVSARGSMASRARQNLGPDRGNLD